MEAADKADSDAIYDLMNPQNGGKMELPSMEDTQVAIPESVPAVTPANIPETIPESTPVTPLTPNVEFPYEEATGAEGAPYADRFRMPQNEAPLSISTEGAGDVGKIITEIEYKPSSGVIFKANPDKTTTILGSFDKDMKNIVGEMGNVKSTYFGARKGGFNVLNVPDELYNPDTFWDLYNKPWLDEAINRGDDIVLATKPDANVLKRLDYSTGKEVLTGFGKEIDYLTQKGYIYDATTNTMKLR